MAELVKGTFELVEIGMICFLKAGFVRPDCVARLCKSENKWLIVCFLVLEFRILSPEPCNPFFVLYGLKPLLFYFNA